MGEETEELTAVNNLLHRVFTNKEQVDKLYRFLRSRYGSQFHMLSSPTVNYLVRPQCSCLHGDGEFAFRSFFNAKLRNSATPFSFSSTLRSRTAW